MANPGQLPEEYRTHLDKIVDQLEREGTPEADIKETVADYKKKYALPAMLGAKPPQALQGPPLGTLEQAKVNLPSSALNFLQNLAPPGLEHPDLTDTRPGYERTWESLKNTLSGIGNTALNPQESFAQDPVGTAALPATILASILHPTSRTFMKGAVKAGAASIPENLGMKAGLSIPAALVGELVKGPTAAAGAALAAGALPVAKDMLKGGMTAVQESRLTDALKKSAQLPWEPKKVNYSKAPGTSQPSGPSYPTKGTRGKITADLFEKMTPPEKAVYKTTGRLPVWLKQIMDATGTPY